MLHDRDYINFVFKEIKKTFWKIKGKFKVYQFIAMVKEREKNRERERVQYHDVLSKHAPDWSLVFPSLNLKVHGDHATLHPRLKSLTGHVRYIGLLKLFYWHKAHF